MKSTIKARLMSLLMVPAFALSAASVAVIPMTAEAQVRGGADSAKSAEQSSSLEGEGGVFQQVTNVLLFIIGAVSVIMLIIGGIRYTISGGDSSQVTAAKNTILYAVVGIIVALLAYAVVNYVIGSFSASE